MLKLRFNLLYLFNDITGLYLLEQYDMISKIDTIYFGNNDNYFINLYGCSV